MNAPRAYAGEIQVDKKKEKMKEKKTDVMMWRGAGRKLTKIRQEFMYRKLSSKKKQK